MTVSRDPQTVAVLERLDWQVIVDSDDPEHQVSSIVAGCATSLGLVLAII